MRTALLGLALSGVLAVSANGLVVETSEQSHVAAQGFVRHGDTLFRVADGQDAMCIMSGTSDWRRKTLARHAKAFDRAARQAGSFEGGLSRTIDTDLSDLRLVAPRLTFGVGAEGPKFLRIGIGARVAPGGVRVEYGPGYEDSVAVSPSIERSRETVIFRQTEAIQGVYDAFLSGQNIRIVAKVSPHREVADHYVIHVFESAVEEQAVASCLAADDATVEQPVAFGTPRFKLTPVTDLDVSERVKVRRVIEAEDLNGDETDIFRISGDGQGIFPPSSYAILRRSEEGVIEAIWSGRDWRLLRDGDRYRLFVARALIEQSVLEAPERLRGSMKEVECAQLRERRPGEIEIFQCFDHLLAKSGVAVDHSSQFNLAVPDNVIRPGPFRAATYGAGTGSSSSRVLVATGPSSIDDLEQVGVFRALAVPVVPTIAILAVLLSGIAAARYFIGGARRETAAQRRDRQFGHRARY